MSPRFEVIEAKRFHCGMMTRIMRRSYLTMMAQAGADPHRELRACFDQSAFRKAWMIDGRLAALGGVIGTLASGDGMVWLALSEEATRRPFGWRCFCDSKLLARHGMDQQKRGSAADCSHARSPVMLTRA